MGNLSINGFIYKNNYLEFNNPMILTVKFDEKMSLYSAEYENLCIVVNSYSIENLRYEVYDILEFLWDIYVNGDDSKMTKESIELKNKLVSMIKKKKEPTLLELLNATMNKIVLNNNEAVGIDECFVIRDMYCISLLDPNHKSYSDTINQYKDKYLKRD